MITWRTILLAWTMVGVAATGDSAEAASCKLAQVATWPLRLVGNHLLVDGEINGQKIGIMECGCTMPFGTPVVPDE